MKISHYKIDAFLKKLILPFALLAFSINGYAQNIPTDAPNVIPPSPEAQAFQKYGQYNVDLSTGVPVIDIPLYEIHSGKLSLPVSLSYHASGIKINDIATIVGLGWSLKAGGMVSRTVRGLPDEVSPNGFLNQIHNTQATIDNTSPDHNLFTYLNGIALTTNDGQSDSYFYSAGDKLSGQFVYDINNNITPLSYTESKITRNIPNDTFDIVGDDGTDYQFTQIETQQATGITGTYTSSWYLTKMISYDKADVITFEYNSVNTGDADCYLSFSKYQLTSSGQWSSSVTANRTAVIYNNEVLLTKIDFKNGFVQFDYQNGRLDRRQYQLNDVSINSINTDNTTNLLKKYTFNYSYFNSGGSDSYNNRLKLDKINILDKNSQAVSNYAFAYNPARLPAYFNPNDQTYIIGSYQGWLSMDYWGYYNGAQNTSYIPGLPANGSSGINPANRSANENYMQADMLQQITYPTGGITNFTFEGNRDVNNNLVGGLRINKITSTTSAGAAPIVKRYVYNASSVLNLLAIPSNYQYFVRHEYATLQPGGDYYIYTRDDRTNYFGSYPWPLAEHNGSSIIYTSVTEYTDGGGSPSLRTDYGYQLDNDRQYTTNCDRLDDIYFADRSWARGQLINTLYYQYLNGTYQKLKEVDDLYTPLKTGTVNTGLIAYKSFINSDDNWVWTDTKTLFYYFDVLLDYGNRKLQQENTIEYDNNQNPTRITSRQFQYNSTAHLYPTQETTTDSKGEAITKTTQYVPDITQTGTAETARQQLLTANNISPVLQQNVQKGTASTTESLSYNSWNNYPYPNIATKQYGSGPSITEYANTNYDTFGNPTQTQKLIGPPTSYQWGYNGQYPVAKVSNTLNTAAFSSSQGVAATTQLQVASGKTVSFKTYGTGTITVSITLTGAPNAPFIVPYTLNASGGSLCFPFNNASYCGPNGGHTSDTFPNMPQGTYTVSIGSISSPGTVQANLTINYTAEQDNYSGYKDFFYESFEEGAGNSVMNDSKTGHYSYVGAYTQSITNLENGSYVLSYWQKTGGTWSLQSSSVTVSNNTYTISLNGQVDDVRLYPWTAQMTTYTYDPLVGMTSSTDAKNEVTYYEYDSFQRLMNIKDQNGNIVKHIDYHYQGQ